MSFKKEFKRFSKAMNRINEKKGFLEIDEQIEKLYENYGVPAELVDAIKQARTAQKLMLIVGELGEAIEALRHDNPPDNHIPKFSGMEAELADAVIRIQNLAENNRYRLADAIVAKAAYNSNRPYRHGGKKF